MDVGEVRVHRHDSAWEGPGIPKSGQQRQPIVDSQTVAHHTPKTTQKDAAQHCIPQREAAPLY